MDSWSSQIAREVIFGGDYTFAPIYFVSYLFVVGIVMANVVVAILLDKYLAAVKKINEEESEKQEFEELDVLSKQLYCMDTEDLHDLLRKITSPHSLDCIDDSENLIQTLLSNDIFSQSLYEIMETNVIKKNQSQLSLIKKNQSQLSPDIKDDIKFRADQ